MRGAATILISLVAVLVLWQGLVWLIAPPPYILPSPLQVAAVFARRWDYLLEQAWITTAEILLGLLFGLVAGVMTALLVVALPRVGQLVWPLVLVLQVFPVFALAPLLVIWFGFGLASKVVMTSLIIFFPIASAFADGLRRTDPSILDMAAVGGANRWQVLWAIRLPLALPGLVSGLRVAAPLAPLGAVIGEWVGASGGLGLAMIQSNARMQTDMVFAAVAVLAVLALLLRFLVDELAARLTPWAKET